MVKKTINIQVDPDRWQAFKALAMLRGNSVSETFQTFVSSTAREAMGRLEGFKDMPVEEPEQLDSVNDGGAQESEKLPEGIAEDTPKQYPVTSPDNPVDYPPGFEAED